MRIVAALGGNALLRGEAFDVDVQEHHIAEAAAALAPLTDRHELIVTHGEDPQVGLGCRLVEALERELPAHHVACLRARTIVAAAMIERLVSPEVVIVCATDSGAAVDKDLTAALLAEQVGADRLLLLTDVPAVLDGWGSAAPRPIGRAGVGWFRRRSFAAGSMGPKVDAACQFVEHTGRSAFVGALEQVEAILAGRSGTEVTATPGAIG